jgi:hypothetical protein
MMKFFTPELYRRYNSLDDAVADQADQEWESNVRAYKGFIARHVGDMNDRVRELAERLSLHDSELLSIQEDVPNDGGPLLPFHPIPVATVSVKNDQTVTSLIYFLWSQQIEQAHPQRDWPFSTRHIHWLYDEIDVERQSSLPPFYWHRILWSNGSIISIPFFDVVVQTYSTLHPDAPDAAVIIKKRA